MGIELASPAAGQPQDLAAAAAEQEQYHPTAEKLKVKKRGHRRTGSHSSSVRDSPLWERKVFTFL